MLALSKITHGNGAHIVPKQTLDTFKQLGLLQRASEEMQSKYERLRDLCSWWTHVMAVIHAQMVDQTCVMSNERAELSRRSHLYSKFTWALGSFKALLDRIPSFDQASIAFRRKYQQLPTDITPLVNGLSLCSDPPSFAEMAREARTIFQRTILPLAMLFGIIADRTGPFGDVDLSLIFDACSDGASVGAAPDIDELPLDFALPSTDSDRESVHDDDGDNDDDDDGGGGGGNLARALNDDFTAEDMVDPSGNAFDFDYDHDIDHVYDSVADIDDVSGDLDLEYE